MRRAFAIGTGLVVAMATALLVLPTAALVTAWVGGYGSRDPASLIDIAVAFAWSSDADRLIHAALAAAARTLAVTCCAPVVCVALIGEAAGLAGFTWYVAATAAASAVFPLAASATSGSLGALAHPAASAPLLIAGAGAGLVYRGVAGSPTARDRSSRRTLGAGFGLAAETKPASETYEP